MGHGTGGFLWRMMCGLCKANISGPDFNHVRVFETKNGGLKVEFIIGPRLVGRLDRDAQDAVVALVCRTRAIPDPAGVGADREA